MKFIFERLTTVKLFRGGVGIGPLNKKILPRDFRATAYCVVNLTGPVITVSRPQFTVVNCHSNVLQIPGLTLWSIYCFQRVYLFKGGIKMLVSTDTIDRELQVRLLKETSDLYARKQKLEADIRSLDAVNNSLQGTAALRDIEAHKSQRPVSAKLR